MVSPGTDIWSYWSRLTCWGNPAGPPGPAAAVWHPPPHLHKLLLLRESTAMLRPLRKVTNTLPKATLSSNPLRQSVRPPNTLPSAGSSHVRWGAEWGKHASQGGRGKLTKLTTYIDSPSYWRRSIFGYAVLKLKPTTAAARSKTWTAFARSNAGIVVSNPTQGMDVCVCLFCDCVVLRVGSGFATGSPTFQGALPTVNWMEKLKKKKNGPSSSIRNVEPRKEYFEIEKEFYIASFSSPKWKIIRVAQVQQL
jgi:hypothetical protein